MPESESKHVEPSGGGTSPWWARVALVASLIVLGWLLMQALHEAGHVVHAWLSGATVERVELHPLRLSRTTLGVNPHPRFVAWGGAVWGCVLPLLLVLATRPFGPERVAIARALAGGCLLANGVYLGTGPFTLAGDAGDLLLTGASPASLVVFGLTASVGGLCLWNGVGERLASAARAREIGVLMCVLGVLTALELAAAG